MAEYLGGFLAGTMVGVALYLCVRARMKYGPLALARFGPWARRLVWVLSMLLVIAIANLGLVVFRELLSALLGREPSLGSEVCFAITGLVVGCVLVLKHMHSGESAEDTNTK